MAFAQRLAWEKFTIDVPGVGAVPAEKGWVEVPERHSQPNGTKIRLYLVRLAAATPKPGPPIIWLSGGPGSPGARTPASPAWYRLFENLRKHGDVIALDQRGTGSSQPSLVIPGSLDLPPDESVNSSEALHRLTVVAETMRETLRERGIDLAAYNTVESAHDVNAIRTALGAERIVLFAHSYGTHLALATIKQHGPHIDRAILGGVSGLDQRWRYPADSDAWLTAVATKMRQDASLAKAVPDFKEQVKRVFAELDRDPIRIQRDSTVVLIGRAEIQTLVTIQSGDIQFVRNLPVLFTNLEKRTDLDTVATAVQRVIRQRPIGTAMTYAMHAASGVSDRRSAQIRIQAQGAIFGNAINWGIGDEAFVRALNVPDLGESFRRPFRSRVPVLLISATLDGRTSESDARAVGRQFENASYVAIDGASHDFFAFSPPQLVSIMDRFLRHERLTEERITVPIEFRRPD